MFFNERKVDSCILLILTDISAGLDRVDMIGASLTYENEIAEFAASYWSRWPWVKDIAAKTMLRLKKG